MVASPADERAQALHQLAEKVGVVVANVPFIRQTLEDARYFPGIPPEVLNALALALQVLADCELACAQAVALFDRVRKVV